MGFSYSQFGLCCDFCGNSKPEFNVKKIACPYGYCQAWACCKNCHAKKLHLQSSCSNKTHKEHCKLESIRFDLKENEKQTLINKGFFVRSAALSHDDKVKVIFTGKNKEKAFFMTHKEYDKIPLNKITVVEDYEILSKCKSLDLHEDL